MLFHFKNPSIPFESDGPPGGSDGRKFPNPYGASLSTSVVPKLDHRSAVSYQSLIWEKVEQ